MYKPQEKKLLLILFLKILKIRFLAIPFVLKDAFYLEYTKFCFKDTCGLPWWSSDEESSSQCMGHHFDAWSRKIPHAVEQLSPCATTIERSAPEPGSDC